MEFTKAQENRLHELGCSFDSKALFPTASDRDAFFRKLEREGIKRNNSALQHLREEGIQPAVSSLEQDISQFLRESGFIEVRTPLFVSRKFLERMTLKDDHSLLQQVFWVDDKTCLRPMLAPNLYDISKRMLNLYEKPLGVFEIGPCFRKESQGSKHLENFTMVNFVEWGTPEAEKESRMRDLIDRFMERIGLPDFEVIEETSVVYGKTIDVMVNDVEIASVAFGPHPLDEAWGITDTWLGLGAGLERIVMLRDDVDSIQKVGRSLIYLDGNSLNFK